MGLPEDMARELRFGSLIGVSRWLGVRGRKQCAQKSGKRKSRVRGKTPNLRENPLTGLGHRV